MQSKEKWFISCPSSSHLLIIVSTRPVARHCHCSLFLLWKSKTRRVKDTSMLITVCLSAMETHVLECFVHLDGPSPWLAAVWRLTGWSGGEGLVMLGQSSPRVVLLQGTWPLSRKGGRAGTTGGHRLLHCFTAHTQADCWLFSVTSLFSGRCKKLKSCQCFCSQAPLFHCVLRSQVQIIESL